MWIIDLEENRVHFYRSLADGQYQDVSVTREPQSAVVPGLADAQVDLTGLLEP